MDPTTRYLHALYTPYLLCPDAEALRVELRCLRAVPTGIAGEDARSLFFGVHAIPSAVRTALHWAARWNVYVGVLPRQRGCGKGQSAISVAAWLFCDLDGASAGPALPRQAVGLPHDLPPPHLLVGSGGGVHAYWRLADPVCLSGPADRQRFNATLRRLARHIGGQAAGLQADLQAAEVARVLRVPGTCNWKRPAQPRPVSLIDCAAEAPAFSLDWWSAHLPAEPVRVPRCPPRPVRAPGQSLPLAPATCQKLAQLWPQGQKYGAIRSILAAARHAGWDEAGLYGLADLFCQKHQCDRRPVEALVRATLRRISA